MQHSVQLRAHCRKVHLGGPHPNVSPYTVHTLDHWISCMWDDIPKILGMLPPAWLDIHIFDFVVVLFFVMLNCI